MCCFSKQPNKENRLLKTRRRFCIAGHPARQYFWPVHGTSCHVSCGQQRHFLFF